MALVTWLLALQSITRCLAYPWGAPDSACDSMVPQHPFASQGRAEDCPYDLEQERFSYAPDDSMEVVLKSRGAMFTGFLVRALDSGGEGVGRFVEGVGIIAKQFCSAVTHANADEKFDVRLTWLAPSSRNGKVHFR
ncbi:putative defense protein [Haemaphysalis longicornis]